MDPKSGLIHQVLDTPEAQSKAKRHGLIELTPEQADAMRFMNRKQRRAWAAQQRKARHAVR